MYDDMRYLYQSTKVAINWPQKQLKMPFLNFGLQWYTVGCHGNIIVNQFRWCFSLSCSSLLVVSIKCVCFIMMESSCL